MKKTLLTVLAVVVFAFGADAETIEISNASEFVAKLAATGDYVLTSDIDLAGSGYVSLGEFSGTFNGDGHTITGLGAQPLFALCVGSVHSLTIDGTADGANTVREQDGAGVVCDRAENAVFVGLVVKGYTLHHKAEDRNVQDGNGLVVGMTSGDIVFERCLADASCCLYQQTIAKTECNNKPMGGIAGAVDLTGTKGLVEFVDCTNRATIVCSKNWTANVAGTGGIVGNVKKTVSNQKVPKAVLTRCINEVAIANLNSSSMNVGGLVGMAGTGNMANYMGLELVDCANLGDIAASVNGVNAAGGMVAYLLAAAYLELRGCVNRGNVGMKALHPIQQVYSYRTAYAGGLVGYAEKAPSGTAGTSFLVRNCANYGKITGAEAGGMIGQINGVNQSTATFVVANSSNHGTLDGVDYAGEVFARLIANVGVAYAPTFSIDNCWTTGPQLYASSLVAPAVSNCRTAEQDDETALAELVAVARAADGYALWKIGETTHPEVGVRYAAGEVLDPIVQLSEPTVELSEDGTLATVSVSVTNSTLTTGALELKVNGTVKAIWPLAVGTFTTDLKTKKGKVYEFAFTASGSRTEGEARDTASGTFVPTEKTNWFTVDLTDAGYVDGPNWVNQSVDKDGGTWSETEAGSTLAGGKVTFAEGSAAVTTYRPKKASEEGADVFVTGALYVDETDKAKLPDNAPFAIAFEMDMDKLVCYPTVYANGVWTRFGDKGDGLAVGSWVDYRVDIDHAGVDAPQVRVTVGGATSAWLPVAVAKRSVSAIGFTGGGFASFAGAVYSRKPVGGLLLLVR